MKHLTKQNIVWGIFNGNTVRKIGINSQWIGWYYFILISCVTLSELLQGEFKNNEKVFSVNVKAMANSLMITYEEFFEALLFFNKKGLLTFMENKGNGKIMIIGFDRCILNKILSSDFVTWVDLLV